MSPPPQPNRPKHELQPSQRAPPSHSSIGSCCFSGSSGINAEYGRQDTDCRTYSMDDPLSCLTTKAQKYTAFVLVGILTLAYSVFEIFMAIQLSSLTLMSDGFHNLSDVIALLIAFWALWKSSEVKTTTMTYGWKRAEILGAVMNGCFLVALALYVVLEAIPRFVSPPIEDMSGWWFIIIAATGLGINLFGTLVFSFSGTHGHSHVGKGAHSHGHGDDHSHTTGDIQLPEGTSTRKRHRHEGKEEHHKPEKQHEPIEEWDGGARCEGCNSCFGRFGCGGGDMNIQAVFIHYLGDAVSSLFVLVAGLLLHYFPNVEWVVYVDPGSSLLIVLLILASVIPLILNCSRILLQQAPKEIDCGNLKSELEKIPGVQGIHELHVWQLIDSVIIASLHVMVWDNDTDNRVIVSKCKKLLHRNGIHSITIQLEYLNHFSSPGPVHEDVCPQNCTKNCVEDWCCKVDGNQQLFSHGKEEDVTLKENNETVVLLP
eukprot:TRINITY_DN10374_c0_g1_i1.p1 TRINITY_DN10374_c0_g1~~TRINITY_DN10374_c0_g1_i1.p1  ORF type:complete len:485 (+),score=87.45 TRINITY_DN10374_c0_g1_i1:771-2225(+)